GGSGIEIQRGLSLDRVERTRPSSDDAIAEAGGSSGRVRCGGWAPEARVVVGCGGDLAIFIDRGELNAASAVPRRGGRKASDGLGNGRRKGVEAGRRAGGVVVSRDGAVYVRRCGNRSRVVVAGLSC